MTMGRRSIIGWLRGAFLLVLLGFAVSGAATAGDGVPYVDDVRPPVAGPGAGAGAASWGAAPAGLGPASALQDIFPAAGPAGAAFWRRIREGVAGRTLVTEPGAAVLVRTGGQAWREAVVGSVRYFGAWLLLLAGLAVAALYVVRGRTPVAGRGKRKHIVRFNLYQRIAHWLTAVSFLLLALTGLNLIYGRDVLRNLLGPDHFALLTMVGKVAHNYVGIVFLMGVIMLAILWFPGSGLEAQVKQAARGGARKGPMTGKYNWLQKFSWAVFVLGGLLLAATGGALLLPVAYAESAYAGVLGIRQVQLGHSFLGLVLLAAACGHFYYGALAREGSLTGIIGGRVSEAWARLHHRGWYESVALRQEIPALAGTAGAAETPETAPPPKRAAKPKRSAKRPLPRAAGSARAATRRRPRRDNPPSSEKTSPDDKPETPKGRK